MHERIKELRQILRLSQVEFAKKLHITQPAFSILEAGKTKVLQRNIESICNTFGVSERWLKTGSGAMFTKDTNNVSLEDKAFFAEYLSLPDEDRDFMQMALKTLVNAQVGGMTRAHSMARAV
jgi:transcriptional regulator with XRE-family HTH domain